MFRTCYKFLMRAAIYLRVSTDRQDTGNQEPECVALCARRGWEPKIYTETASGAKVRPVWETVQADARRGHVGAVVAWSLDRFGRTMHGILDAVREFDSRGIVAVTVQEPWLADTFGTAPLRTLMISAFSFAAELERERLIERIHRGITTARARDIPLGRPRKIDGEGLRLLIELRQSGRKWCDVGIIMQARGFHRDDGQPYPKSSLQTAYNHVLYSGAVNGTPDGLLSPGKSGGEVDPRQVPLNI